MGVYAFEPSSAVPGRGAPTRGRGDAELTWGRETGVASSAFETVALPDARARDLESSAVLGVGAAAPPVEPDGGPSGLVDLQSSSGKAAWKRRLSPSHRAAVQEFFAPRSRNE